MPKNRWDPDWTCPLCNVVIFGRHAACKKCKTPKLKPGDWVCRLAPCVQTFNFAWRTACLRCDQAKPDACNCTEPQYETLYVNGKFRRVGHCERCLLSNPTPWYTHALDAEEANLRKNDVPQEHWRYEVRAEGRAHESLSGLGERVPGYSNFWWFHTRDTMEAELMCYKPGTSVRFHVLDGRSRDILQ